MCFLDNLAYALCMEPRRRPKGTKGAGQFAPKPRPSPPATVRTTKISKQKHDAQASSLPGDAFQSTDDDSADRSRESAPAPSMQEATERADRYLEELIQEVGQPSPKAVAEAEALWNRIERARAAQAVG